MTSGAVIVSSPMMMLSRTLVSLTAVSIVPLSPADVSSIGALSVTASGNSATSNAAELHAVSAMTDVASHLIEVSLSPRQLLVGVAECEHLAVLPCTREERHAHRPTIDDTHRHGE